MKRGVRHTAFALLLAAVASATGCTAPHQVLVTDVDSTTWEQEAMLTFSNADTVTMRDIDLVLRCNDRFTEDTLTVNIRLWTPDHLRIEEAVRIAVPHINTPAALVREAVAPYRRRVILRHPNTYRLTIQPVRPVRGIEAVGIKIAKSH